MFHSNAETRKRELGILPRADLRARVPIKHQHISAGQNMFSPAANKLPGSSPWKNKANPFALPNPLLRGFQTNQT